MKLSDHHTEKKLITGIILAGGKSSRMGEDKATKLHNGIPFLSHIIKVLEFFSSRIIIVSDHPTHSQFGHIRIPDMVANKGPLGGIYTGLIHSNTQKNIVLSCDIPFITIDVLSHLIINYDSSYDTITYEESPLLGIYHKSITQNILANIRNEELSMRKNLKLLHSKFLKIEEKLIPYIQNINTQEHYKKVLKWN